MPALQQPVLPLEVIYGKVVADSQFSLHYLRAVNAAINVATIVRNNAETSEKACTQILALLADSGGFKKPIDSAGNLASASVSAETTVKETIRAFQDLDGVLDGSTIAAEHAEDVSVSNEEAIGALQKLHDALVDLRWAVIEHDADLEEPEGKAFDNVEDLVADLRSS